MTPSTNINCYLCLTLELYYIYVLRPLTLGKRFLLFCPDSHSAYYDSFISALGWSLPPLTGSFKDLLYLKIKKFLAEKEWGGPPALATLALGTSVGFLGIGQSD